MVLKRIFDLLVALIAGFVLLPIIALVGLVVRIRLGRPVLFRQTRVGLDEQSFRILKFRTMNDRRGPGGELLSDAERLTAVGSRLRSWSVDELPELWNVLRGEMSLVGPRPLPVAYLPRYTVEERRRHEVRPGITGWAQVNGRNTTSWEQRLAMDVWYVDHWSFWLDIRIMGRTVATVMSRSGISAEGEATMAELRPPGERA